MKFPDKVKIWEIMTRRMQISEMFIHVFKNNKLGVVSLADCNHPTDLLCQVSINNFVTFT